MLIDFGRLESNKEEEEEDPRMQVDRGTSLIKNSPPPPRATVGPLA